jgi:hypothetical protein
MFQRHVSKLCLFQLQALKLFSIFMGGPLYIVPLDACFDGTASGFVLSPLVKLVSNPDQVGSGHRLDVASGNNYVSKNT